MRLLFVCCAVLFFTGCAKHGYLIETDKDFKGNISIGWGPMTVIDADVAGGFRACIPSKAATKDDPTDNWCTKFMKVDAPP